MKTTLNEIKKRDPCIGGWKKLLENLGKTSADDEPLPLMQILTSNGIEDAVWALKCFDYKGCCLFLADVAESVLHIYESEYDNPAPRNAIKAIRDYHAGLISKSDLQRFSHDAYAAAYAANAANADYAADAAAAGAGAAAAYTDGGNGGIFSAVDAAEAFSEKWAEIEQLFIKHFGDNK